MVYRPPPAKYLTPDGWAVEGTLDDRLARFKECIDWELVHMRRPVHEPKKASTARGDEHGYLTQCAIQYVGWMRGVRNSHPTWPDPARYGVPYDRAVQLRGRVEFSWLKSANRARMRSTMVQNKTRGGKERPTSADGLPNPSHPSAWLGSGKEWSPAPAIGSQRQSSGLSSLPKPANDDLSKPSPSSSSRAESSRRRRRRASGANVLSWDPHHPNAYQGKEVIPYHGLEPKGRSRPRRRR